MKYILVIGDGMADNPVPELDGKTPLEAADKKFIDGLAAKSKVAAVISTARMINDFPFILSYSFNYCFSITTVLFIGFAASLAASSCCLNLFQFSTSYILEL